MKKAMKTIMMLFVASSFILTSCSSEDVADVTLTTIPASTGTTFFVGDTMSVTINAKGNADNKLKSLTITKAVTGKATITYYTKDLSVTDYIFELKDTLDIQDTGAVTYNITLTGEKGTAQTKTITISVSKVGFIDETNGSPVQMFGHTYDGPRFCQLTTFETYSVAQVADAPYTTLTNNVDLVSYFGSSNKFTLSSPDDAVMQSLYSGLSGFWTSGKARVTGLVRVNGLANFATIAAPGDDRLLVLFAAGKTYGKTITNVQANDLILFKTAGGRLGLIKITSVSGTTSSDAQVQFETLVQY
jgi:hypothetical protein